jgi:hypothetical protein
MTFGRPWPLKQKYLRLGTVPSKPSEDVIELQFAKGVAQECQRDLRRGWTIGNVLGLECAHQITFVLEDQPACAHQGHVLSDTQDVVPSVFDFILRIVTEPVLNIHR